MIQQKRLHESNDRYFLELCKRADLHENVSMTNISTWNCQNI